MIDVVMPQLGESVAEGTVTKWLVREGDSPALERLMEALRQSADALLKSTEWTLSTQEADGSATASLEFHRQVFLFFREAMHNIARHSRATKVTIEAGWDAQRFRLRIADDGVGFDPGASGGGSGLANLRHRASVIGGTVEITSAPGEGTRIRLEAPLS